jgi:hypothetical protein
MRKGKIIADRDERMCLYCEHSTPIAETDACICDINGMVKTDGYCRKYVLDLLKVNPRPPKPVDNTDPEIFSF